MTIYWHRDPATGEISTASHGTSLRLVRAGSPTAAYDSRLGMDDDREDAWNQAGNGSEDEEPEEAEDDEEETTEDEGEEEISQDDEDRILRAADAIRRRRAARAHDEMPRYRTEVREPTHRLAMDSYGRVISKPLPRVPSGLSLDKLFHVKRGRNGNR